MVNGHQSEVRANQALHSIDAMTHDALVRCCGRGADAEYTRGRLL